MDQVLLKVTLLRLFLARNIIPVAIVPNGVQDEDLIDGITRLFFHLFAAHMCEDNRERQHMYDDIQQEYVEEWPQEHRHWVNEIKNFLNNQALHNNF
jgi:hypothetical protein